MAALNIILGKSGNGKSHSVGGLDPSTTIILNVKNKRLPFKNFREMYNKEKKNIFHPKGYGDTINLLNNISERAENIKTIIIDDAIYLMRDDFATALTTKGGGSAKFDMYNEVAVNFKNLMETCENLRDDINIFLMFHPEDETSDDSIVSMKVATLGKLTDRICKPEELVDVLLVCKPRKDDDGNLQYGFYTHKCYVDGQEIPAKTPHGMFEEDFIDNDLGLVVNKINKYYG